MTIKPRKYSIASSPAPAPAQEEDTSTITHGVSLVVGVLEYTTGKQNMIFFNQSKYSCKHTVCRDGSSEARLDHGHAGHDAAADRDARLHQERAQQQLPAARGPGVARHHDLRRVAAILSAMYYLSCWPGRVLRPSAGSGCGGGSSASRATPWGPRCSTSAAARRP